MTLDEDFREDPTSVARRVGFLEGQLAEAKEQVATLEASAAQSQLELEAARAATAAMEHDLSHLQRRAKDREEALHRRTVELEARLEEAQRLQREAAAERRAVIAALGRRGRRLLAADASGDA